VQPAERFDVTQPDVGSVPAGRLGVPPARRLLAGFAALAVPALIAVLAVRYLVPSRLEGTRGGLTGVLAWLGYHQPLLLGVALFLAISEAGRYWIERSRADGADRAALPPPREFQRRSLRRLAIALGVVAAVAFALRASVVAAFRVTGPSMLPTLESGDYVMVNRLAYGFVVPYTKLRLGNSLPRRGDLVVFRANGLTGADGPQSVVKRVIGLPGDEVAFAQGTIVINGWKVPACDAGPYVDLGGKLVVRGRLTVEFLDDKAYLTVRNLFERPFEGYQVKPGEVFVLGDDRGASSDSRIWNDRRGAGVPVDTLEGRVSRVLAGARPDGRLDLGTFAKKPFDLKVRLADFDLHLTDERIQKCLERRPANTWVPTAP
jgi:signal peptidase I